MPDDADELILKMQHLEAQARAQEEARAKQGGAQELKTRERREWEALHADALAGTHAQLAEDPLLKKT